MKYKMKQQAVYIYLAIFLFFCGISEIFADEKISETKAGEEINWQVMSSGGTDGASSNFILGGTVSQTVVGVGSSTNFVLKHGYWQNFDTTGSGPCDCEPGEVNADGTINIFDITYTIGYLYLSGPAPIPYTVCNGDPNCDCTCNIFDITYLISFLYLDGPPPCSCNGWLTACGMPLRE
jgi:hypothetical protein